jgi:hypothetical protein
VVPALFLIASLAIVLNALWTQPVDTGITFAIILAGIPAWLLWRRFGRNDPVTGAGTA